MPGDHCTYVGDDDDIRQGDIIAKRCISGSLALGVIVTADCDIAQNKSGGVLNWLEIVPSTTYLEEIWAVEQLRRIVEKQVPICCAQINDLLKRTSLKVSDLTERSLIEWLREDTPDNIVDKLAATSGRRIDSQLKRLLGVVVIALGHDDSPTQLARLRAAWSMLGRSTRTQQAAIRDAFSTGGAFADFILVPDLPRADGIGFAVLLRAISSIPVGNLYTTEADARASDNEHAYFRIGRFNDTTRYAIAQKLAFLFSRIGMPRHFESECEAATNLLVETVYGGQQ